MSVWLQTSTKYNSGFWPLHRAGASTLARLGQVTHPKRVKMLDQFIRLYTHDLKHYWFGRVLTWACLSCYCLCAAFNFSFRNNRHMALLQMENPQQAVAALVVSIYRVIAYCSMLHHLLAGVFGL